MSTESNKQAAKDGYEAFGKGDIEAAMAQISDSIEWVVGGDNSVTGTYRGKEELAGFWWKLAEKSFQVEPTEFLADGDKVAVLSKDSVGDAEVNTVDVLSYDGDGQLIRFETFGGEALLNEVFAK
ncbi:MAG: nuclear transport factor 2 family protein [Actinomycetota bacterium]|nr:nuclear transport factor 2 family protein [Actinomycetota bacterium]